MNGIRLLELTEEGLLTMYKDEILSELWRNRSAYAETHHHNLDEIVADLKQREKKSGLTIIDRQHTRTDGGITDKDK